MCWLFFVLGVLGCRAYPGRTAAVLLGSIFYGGLIEILQSFTLTGHAEWGDLLADAIGAALACGLIAWRR
jgi:VanZ family protein